MATNAERRTVVIGLDGADFELLTPWIEAGELPALERVLAEGVSGDLESVLPPVTSPNWKAYSTGKNPAKFGIFWWWNVDVEDRRTYRPTERYNATREYWEILAENEPVGVLGVPTTYPPKEFGSFVVSGAPDGEDEGFAYPDHLCDELRERFDYRISKEHTLRERSDEAYEEVLELIDSRFRAGKYLADRYDVSFLQLTTFYINALHHHLWEHEYTLEGWKIIDDHLASFLGNGDNVVLMSDHGMAEVHSVFRVNQWLSREGYLAYDASTSERMRSIGIHSDRLKVLVSRLNRVLPALDVERLVDRAVPQWVLNAIPNAEGELGSSKHSQIDWEGSRALASGLGPVYLLDGAADGLRDELGERLSSLTDPEGRPVATAVHPGEEVYSGAYTDEAPDLLIEPPRNVHVAEEIGDVDVFSKRGSLPAMNARFGIFAAVGPDFRTGTIEGLSILDLAPTLLHLRGCPVPTDMDGEVRRDVFAEGSEPAEREPTFAPPSPEAEEAAFDPESDDMREQLEDLGYL